MNRRGIAALTLSLGLVVGLLAMAGCQKSTTQGSSGEKAPYKIGAVVSLAGTYAGLGVPEKKAIEQEVERINAEGGVNGHKLDVIFEDDGTDAAKAQAAAVKLIDEQGVIAIIGASGTGQSMGMRGDIERAGIPQVSMAGGSVITSKFSKWVFQTPWPNRVVIPFVLKNMKAAGYTKVALISDTGGYGVDGRDIILASAPAAGIEIVADKSYNPGDTDMSSQLTALRAAKPDAILMWAAGKEAAIIVKNARQLNMQQPIYGGSGIARREFIEGAGDAANGVRFGTGKILVPEAYGVGTPEYKVAKSFIDSYSAKYGSAPDIFAGHAYDAIGLIANALKSVEGDADGAKLRDALERTKGWIGIDGTFTYSPTDHNGLGEKDMVMYVIKDGAWQLDK